MTKRTSKYASMTASELGAETRKRGLTKPEGLTNISQWADFLEAEDAKEAQAAAEVDKRPDAEEATEVTSFEEMTVQHLKDYAAKAGIDLGDATKKADIIAVLEAKG